MDNQQLWVVQKRCEESKALTYIYVTWWTNPWPLASFSVETLKNANFGSLRAIINQFTTHCRLRCQFRLVTRNVQTGCGSKNRACLVIKSLIADCACYASAAFYKLTRLSTDGSAWPALHHPRGSNCCKQRWIDVYQKVNWSLFAPALGKTFPVGLDKTRIRLWSESGFGWSEKNMIQYC